MRYLYPQRKRMEIISAIFAGGFGVHIWAASFASSPLAWAGVDTPSALIFGQVMTLAALVHALGVRINGSWRFSPALRLLGMTVHTGLFGYLAWAGIGQTAGYTYAWGCVALMYGAMSALKDTKRALGWDAEWNKA